MAWHCAKKSLKTTKDLFPQKASLEKVPDYLDMEPPYRVGALVIHSSWLPLDRAAVEETLRAAGFAVRYHRADDEFEVYTMKRMSPERPASKGI